MKQILFFISVLFSSVIYSQTISNVTPSSGRVDSCVSQSITWDSSGTSDYYNIYYSVDNGANWISIATSYNTISNTFSWTVPNVSSVNSLIKVTDANQESTFGTSDQVFIIDGSLILLYPSGNENFIAGNEVNIIYDYNATQVSNIKIEYSVDDGSTWVSETNSTVATGSYVWTIPNLPNTSSTKLRLTDTQDSQCKIFESEDNFSITSTVEVITPNGGQTFKAKVGAQGNTVIMNNGPETINTASFYDNGGLNNNYSNQNYTKVISPDFPTNKIKVKFQSYAFENGDKLYIYNGDSDDSPLLGTLSGSSSTTSSYTASNSKGQLTFKFESDQDNNNSGGWDAIISSIGPNPININWNIVGTSKYFNIDYSQDSGSSWTRIVSNYYSPSGSYQWQIPNTPTTNGRIKITDAGNGDILDISDADFTIEAADPFVILYEPNGGESFFPGASTTIEWASAFFNENIRLDYSIDGGSNWLNIIASTNTVSNSFNWTVPGTPSTQVKVRISNPSDVTQQDQSDNLFTILDYITVGNPGNITRCSDQTISWTAGATSGTFKVEYTLDGSTWVSIVDEHSGTATGNNSKSWRAPDVLTSNLQYRITDVEDITKTDTSGVGSITSPPNPVVLISPNGSESFIAGTTQQINYQYGPNTTAVSFKIQYEEGGGWSNLGVDNSFSDGQATFTVPNRPTSSARIRVIGNRDNGCDYDQSDQVFTIVSSVTVTQPNGGESWQATVGVAGHGEDITHSDATRITNTARVVKTYSNENFVQTFYPDSPLNRLGIQFDQVSVSGANRLRVYNGPSPSGGYVKDFYNTTNPGNFNDRYVSSHPSGALTIVTEGNNNKRFTAHISSVGTATREIKWDIVGTSNRFNLDYSIDNGSTWNTIVKSYPISNATLGTYNWQVPNAVSTSALVRVIDAGNGVIIDTSDANFTIAAADPYYAIDNIGNKVPFEQVTLNWDVGGFDQDLIDLHYSVDNGTTWIEIVSDLSASFNGVTPLDGSYDWNLPIGPTAQVVVRISDPDDITIGANTLPFTVTDYITVGYPGNITRCSDRTIGWTAGATSGTFKVEYTLDGSTWVSIVDEHSGTATGNNSKSWRAPDVLTSNLQYRITDVEDITKTDTSGVGSITSPPNPVVLISPNGSESFIAGTTQQINYQYGPNTTAVSFKIQYEEGGGWSNLGVDNSFSDGQATFTVPNRPTSSARIRVIGNRDNGCDYDQSDQVFTIVSSVTVTQPNGGESWQATVGVAGHGEDITHSDATRITNTARVVKTYSNENFVQTFYPDSPLNRLGIQFDQVSVSGANRLRVYNGPSPSGGYVKDFYNTTNPGNFNDRYVSSHPSGALTIVTEGNNNKRFTAHISSVGTATREIKWDIVGTSNRFNLDYSIDNGSTWNTIVKSYPISNATLGTYNWQVPNAVSTSALVRVIDAGNGVIIDTSDANFTIEEAAITLLTQNGGEVYYYDQEHEIIWDSPDSFDQNQSQNVNIDYSINGGTTWLNIVTDYVNSGSYNWTIPEVAEARPQTLVRVQETGNTNKFDISNNYIELRPRLRIVSPNDNQSLFQSCTASSITWYGGATTAYKIEISTNNGVDWATITNPNSTTHFNSYDWSIPNTPSELCLIKVSERDNPEYYDISDNVFTIEPSITITSPLESQNVGSVNTVNISWDSNFTSDTYNIDYSIDFGDTWISVVEEQIFTTTSYDWDISDIDETIIYVKVSDYLSPCKDDIISFSLGLISDINISNDNIDENQNINSLVGEFSVNGTGSGNYVYELISGQGATNNSSFSISNGKLYSNEEFDYESATSKSIRVGVTDQVSNEVFEKEFNIKINDLQDTNYPLGDCNGDFTVSVIDIVMLVDYISGENPSGFFIQNADVNQDGNINVLDIIGIVNIIMGVGDRNNSTETELDLSAQLHWDGSKLLMESNSLVSGLQLEFESYFELNTTELENTGFEVTSYLNGNKFVVLIYSMNGQSIQLGQISLLESLSETPIINVINSLGSDPSLNQISIVFNENSLNTNNINFKESLNLYPNPTDKELHFEFNNLNVQSVEYKIYDTAGREVQKINRVINSSKDFIDLKLSSGTYNILIKIKLPSGEIRQAFEKFIMK